MRIMLSCGEPSGDLYAGSLVAELRSREPGVEVFGMGGPRMAAAGGDVVVDFAPLSVTGLTEALRVVPRAREAFLRDQWLDADRPILALLPGSRRNELARIAGTMAGAARRVVASLPGVQPVVAGVAHLSDDFYAPFAGMPVVRGRTDDVLAYADVAIVASGTATVQAALHERPMVVVYRLSPMTYLLGKPFVKVDTYAMANLVAGERVVPELIQDDFTEGFPSR